MVKSLTFLYKFLTDAVFLTSEDAVFCVKDLCVKFQIPESFVFWQNCVILEWKTEVRDVSALKL